MTTSGLAPTSDALQRADTGSSFDPVLMLASALQAVPGSHAVVLGAGVSIAAGVPSAWGVQEELIRRIAAARGDEVPIAPHDWYRDTYSADATYEGLLEELAPTQHERQAILRSFFEPDPRDGDAEPHEPSQAHIALARLAKSGHLRVFVTLNFDHLMERALRAAGVEPTVVHSLESLEGLAPLHTIRCLVVQLHGDYLTATAMRNTVSELAEYEPAVVDFLQRMLHDHALLIVGWSAQYDRALREQISRSLLERYTSYWVTPSTLGPTAAELATSKRVVHVAATADVALARLADAVDALDARRARHPLTLADAVGAAKREIAGRPVAIGVHDRLRTSLAEIWAHPDLNLIDFQHNAEPVEQVEARVTEAAMTAAALIAATSYWGDARTDSWWMPEVVRFSTGFRGGGSTRLLELPRVVGTVLFHAAGVAAVAAGRFETARALLTAHAAPDNGPKDAYLNVCTRQRDMRPSRRWRS
ncbi:SIR2 family protein [Promicromonospora sp. NFX87]|uniref:SIR2 family protein n=1 Tax=Promicromonospora sp. NFX87 TaxID=3402691 RepID=UPI003AFAB633